jgi:large conductance mechanosensitive channel
MFAGFKKFIFKGNVVDMATGVVIGVAFGEVVSAMVKDLITPLVGVFGGEPDFSSYYFAVNGSKFMYGDFLNSLLSFIMISGVIYFAVVMPMNKIMKKIDEGKNQDPSDKSCPECLSVIPVKAKRCKYCTAQVK